MDEDWHASYQAILQGIDGAEWETMYYQYKELHRAVKFKKSGENNEVKAMWSSKEAKDKGVEFHDLGSVQKIQT